jgi:hypothetical protein
MTSNSEMIIQDIRGQFEQMLDYVTGEEARTATADHIECGLFKMLLKMGAKLLYLFFVKRSEASSREALQLERGEEIPYERDRRRIYFSIFGKIPLMRPYFYQEGKGGRFPLDGELSLGEDSYSDLLREILDYLGVYTVYGKSCDIMKRVLELGLSSRVVQENIADDATEVEAYYAQKAPPKPEEEAEILVIQADGKGVPLILEKEAEGMKKAKGKDKKKKKGKKVKQGQQKVRLGKGEKHGHKKEAIVTTVYTIQMAVRTPAEVVASFFELPEYPKPPVEHDSKPQNKQLWATLDGKDTALDRLSIQVAQRQGPHILYKVALCDGCEALQTRIAIHFPDFVILLDLVHASEYLWDVANCLLGENHPEREPWMADHVLKLLSGQTQSVIADFRLLAQKPKIKVALRKQLNKTANYFERNLPFMDYPTALANGWPIASGVIEGACRHLVKDRCELSGMRWNQSGAESLLRLRAVAENEDWDAYHTYRKQQRHSRLYASPYPSQQVFEAQAMYTPPSTQPALSTHPSNYKKLPLAA